ncbi:hypothetical protein GO495_17635 [Chitinophaga oryziterrae]|uniref:Uncharacterized protein n=1 Tax=Chitinophaga oryziterrae TaxID=1031224 RepID=A0A6N8JDR3_9BACT|nr:hypothetical protein [Chitinophaga oryziterrae]MVT42419.1 hypothetical protein [Chitinophaga oryziterrae]
MQHPELPQKFLDMLYDVLDEKFHEEVYQMYLKGEKEAQEYKEYYYTELWKDLNHVTGGLA